MTSSPEKPALGSIEWLRNEFANARGSFDPNAIPPDEELNKILHEIEHGMEWLELRRRQKQAEAQRPDSYWDERHKRLVANGHKAIKAITKAAAALEDVIAEEYPRATRKKASAFRDDLRAIATWVKDEIKKGGGRPAVEWYDLEPRLTPIIHDAAEAVAKPITLKDRAKVMWAIFHRMGVNPPAPTTIKRRIEKRLSGRQGTP